MPGKPSRFSDEQVNWLKVQDAKGVPRPQIVAAFVAANPDTPLSIARLRQLVGTRATPRHARLAKPARVRATVEVSADELTTVRALAAELGYRNSYGASAGEGNLSDLLAAIAAGELELTRKSA